MATINIINTGTPGSAITKNVSDNTKSTVASVNGSFTPNNLIISADATGTIQNLASVNNAILITGDTGIPEYTGSMTNGQVVIGSSSGIPIPAAITRGTNIAITNEANSITISASGIASFSLTSIADPLEPIQVMEFNRGYIANDNDTLLSFILPTTSPVGSIMEIIGAGTAGWELEQNAGQSILLLNSTTTVGVTGSIASVNPGDSVKLICTIEDTKWTGIPTGNLTIV